MNEKYQAAMSAPVPEKEPLSARLMNAIERLHAAISTSEYIADRLKGEIPKDASRVSDALGSGGLFGEIEMAIQSIEAATGRLSRVHDRIVSSF